MFIHLCYSYLPVASISSFTALLNHSVHICHLSLGLLTFLLPCNLVITLPLLVSLNYPPTFHENCLNWKKSSHWIVSLFSALIKRAVKGDFAEDEKLKVNTSGDSPIILVPATAHGYFVASWWRTPLCHPPKVTTFYFQQTSGIHEPMGTKKRLFFIR
jgi:hypothetical protein